MSSNHLKAKHNLIRQYQQELNDKNSGFLTSTERGGSTSQVIRDYFQHTKMSDNQVITSTGKDSDAFPTNQKDRRDKPCEVKSNSTSCGISSFKRNRGEGKNEEVLEQLLLLQNQVPRNFEDGAKVHAGNAHLRSSDSRQAYESKEMSNMYLEQMPMSGREGGREKTHSGSLNKEDSLLVGGLILSGSAAQLSNDNQDNIEEEALVYSNQSSNIGRSAKNMTMNGRSSGPTINLKQQSTSHNGSHQYLSSNRF